MPTAVIDNFGVAYIALGIGSFIFMVYIACSRIGQVHLGEPGSKPEFKTVSWAAMLFCAGIGIGIMVWAPIEWAYYYQSPPFLVEGYTAEAASWAVAYGAFHWGPVAWSIYLVPALPIAYFYHVRRNPALKLSEALVPVIGARHVKGFWGKLVDVLFVSGMLGGGATTLGLNANSWVCVLRLRTFTQERINEILPKVSCVSCTWLEKLFTSPPEWILGS